MTGLLNINKDNSAAICVFCYNIKSGISCDLDHSPNAINFNTINAGINTRAKINGYQVNRDLFELSRVPINLKLADFGITIIMLHFAKYYTVYPYPIFVNEFKCVPEFEMIERYLLSYNQNHIKLPLNLATHGIYGLKAQQHRFKNSDALSCEAFNFINVAMRQKIEPENFLTIIESLHINIIESFYCFTSITKECKVISECKELTYESLQYTFAKPYKTPVYDGDYWFVLPPKAIWFAYLQGRVKVSYISNDTRESLRIFDKFNIKHVIVGFIHNNQIYPVIIEDPNLLGNWSLTIQIIKNFNLNCVFNDSPLNKPLKNVFFVKNQHHNIFKYIPE